MEDFPKVTILLATFNGEKHLAELIESILAQDYKNISLIISDDASQDQTPAMLRMFQEKYPHIIQLFFSEENVGIVANFSKLMELSDTPYTMLADQDDVWLPFKVSITLAKMKELETEHGLEDPILIVTDLLVVNETLEIINPSFWDLCNLNPFWSRKINHLLAGNAFTGCTMMLNRPLLELADPLPPESVIHDFWISLVASALGRIGIVEKGTVLYRTHSENAFGTRIYSQSFSLQVKRVQNFHLSSAIRAYIFYRRFISYMSEDVKEIFRKYITLKSHNFLKEMYLRIRYGFFRYGFRPNIILIISSYKVGKIKEISKLVSFEN
jgi:glycosyltransferase involved in cell wall biosynthesis